MYTKLSPVVYWITKWQWLQKWQVRQWNCSQEQTQFHLDYIRKTTRENCQNILARRIRLDDYPGYEDIQLPMLAICGGREIGEIKESVLELGRRNSNCKTMILPRSGHEFPQRKFTEINRVIEEFLANCNTI